MEITFEKMLQGPDRDAEWYLELLRHEIPELNEDIVKAFYRQELEALVQAGRLKPQNPRTLAVNVVFCVNDRREQVGDGDVVINGTCDKLKAIAAMTP